MMLAEAWLAFPMHPAGTIRPAAATARLLFFTENSLFEIAGPALLSVPVEQSVWQRRAVFARLWASSNAEILLPLPAAAVFF